ncbi:MAG: hypothetical protein BGO49_00700 [Planctomycetales bacterium 71-10]|nr:MAG: hypothetical protein BGO49_00700 [Planctomycetales bacterium 71-10]
MARPGGPWYWAAKDRWAATIAGKRTLAPREIGKDDRLAALAWYAAAATAATKAAKAAVLTVGDGLEAYLSDFKSRAAADDVTPDTFRIMTGTMTIASRVLVDGKPFHTLPAAEVGVETLDAVVAAWSTGRRLRGGCGRAHLAKNRRKIQTAFRWMAAKGIVPEYKLGEATPIPKTTPETELCTWRHAARWLQWLRRSGARYVDAQFILLQRLLINTGARPSELHRAAWSDVSWDAGRTPHGATYGVLTRLEWKSGKLTGQPRRILLPPSALRPLRRRYEALSPEPSDLIFRTWDGKPWSADMLSKYCRRSLAAAAAAGWDLPASGPGRIRPYQWRHAAASKLIADGVDLPTTAKLLGTSVKMLLQTYVHSDAERLISAAMSLTRPNPRAGRAKGDRPAAAASRRASSPQLSRIARRPRRPPGLEPTPRAPRDGT